MAPKLTRNSSRTSLRHAGKNIAKQLLTKPLSVAGDQDGAGQTDLRAFEQRECDVRAVAAALPEQLPQTLASHVAEAAVPAVLPSGDVILRYHMYNEKFRVSHGCLSAADIDEVYCLSDVMPGCQIHLSEHTPQEKYAADHAGEVFAYICEDPPGRLHGLEVGKEYFVYVLEDEAEFLRAQVKARQMFGNPVQDCDKISFATSAQTLLACRSCQWVGVPRSRQICPTCGERNFLTAHEPFQKYSEQLHRQQATPESDVYGDCFDQASQEARREAYAKGLVGDAHWKFVRQRMDQFNSAQS